MIHIICCNKVWAKVKLILVLQKFKKHNPLLPVSVVDMIILQIESHPVINYFINDSSPLGRFEIFLQLV